MAKKKFSIGNLLASFLIIAILGVGVMFAVSEGFISPDANKIAEASNSDDSVSVIALDSTTKGSIEGALIQTTIQISWNTLVGSSNTGLKPLQSASIIVEDPKHTYSGIVFYFAKMENALNALKYVKENTTLKSSNQLRARGNALYIGEQIPLNFYNKVFF